MMNIFRRLQSATMPLFRQTTGKKPHRNPRGLFLGAVLGGIAGFFVGRFFGSTGYGIIFGALIGSALLYRLNPGPWNRD